MGSTLLLKKRVVSERWIMNKCKPYFLKGYQANSMGKFESKSLHLKKEVVLERWNKFKILHRRLFSTPEEENVSRAVFHEKLQHIEDHNERFRKGLETYEIGENKFTAFTDKELVAFTGLKLPLETPPPLFNRLQKGRGFQFDAISEKSICEEIVVDTPSCFNWKSKGAVTPVKDQGIEYSSCWAFATNAAIESHYKIRTGATVILSEQQLIDCVYDAKGYEGGFMPDAYMYIARSVGINYDSDYPYEGKDGKCRFDSSKPYISLRGYANLRNINEELLKTIVVTRGPVSVGFVINKNFVYYKNGVYYDPSYSTTSLNHAGVIVGYGTENGQDYWLVKNSWGSDWGQGGYIKMARNRGNNCYIASYASYPLF